MKKTATLIKADNTKSVEVLPKDGKTFTLKELQKFVGGYIEIVSMPSGKVLICNEESKLQNPIIANIKATAIWKKEFPISEYLNNNDELVAGDVIITDPKLLDEED